MPRPTSLVPSDARSHGRRIDQINLATALLRSGFMPFLALFLHQRGLGIATIGAVMAFGSIIGLAATVPIGILVDHARRRSRWLVGAGLLALAAPLMLLEAHGMTVLLCAVAMMSVSEAVIAPALLVMNLHDVPPGALFEQLGRNQAFGHIGRVAGLTLSGMIGNHFGFATLIAFEALYLVLLLLLIWRSPAETRQRPLAAAGPPTTGVALRLLGVTLGLFQIGNGALPVLLGLSLVDTLRVSAPLLASGTTIIAQSAMMVGSLLTVPALRRWGYWRVLAASFAVLPLRCALAALLPASVALLPVELLHGLSEAAQMVAIGGAVGDIDGAPGRIATRFGSVMLLRGLGSAASPLIAGYVAERWTPSVAYALLGLIGLLALAFWVACRPQLTRFTTSGRFGAGITELI